MEYFSWVYCLLIAFSSKEPQAKVAYFVDIIFYSSLQLHKMEGFWRSNVLYGDYS